MFEVQLPALKKYQAISAAAAGVGFVIGVVISARAIFANNWPCPFGSGVLQVCAFLGIIGLGSGMVLGNLAALFLIGFAKYRQLLSYLSKKRR